MTDFITPSDARLRNAAGTDTTVERAAEVERLDRLAHLLDARYRIPFTSFRIGIDGLIGLIPGIGDTVMLAPASYMIFRGYQLGARKRTLTKMVGNAGADYLLGLVPLIGDLLDIGYKGNLRNARLLREELARPVRHS